MPRKDLVAHLPANIYSHINNYITQFYYMYLLETDQPVRIIPQRKRIVEAMFQFKGKHYLLFWDYYLQEKIPVETEAVSGKLHRIIFKTEDSYVFEKLPQIRSMREMIRLQAKDLEMMQGKRCIPDPLFNMLCANKTDYHSWLNHKGMMPHTRVLEKLPTNVPKGIIVKLPFYSASKCLGFQRLPAPKCHTDNGVIKQTVNWQIRRLEIKCHLFRGKVMYVMMKSDLFPEEKEPLFDLTVSSINSLRISTEYKNLLIAAIPKIKEKCLQAYNSMNRLLAIKKLRIEEEKKMITEFGLDSTLFATMFTQMKREALERMLASRPELQKYLDYLAIDDVTYDQNNLERIEKYLAQHPNEPYMRVDLGFPDNQNFFELYVNEIESFACGKGFKGYTLPFIKKKYDLNSRDHQVTFDSTQSSVFFVIMEKLLHRGELDQIAITEKVKFE